MPKPRALPLTLTPEERRTLEAWQRVTTMAQGQVRRGRCLLLLAAGVPMGQVAQTVGICRQQVDKIVRRFQVHGLAGMRNRPRGRPRKEPTHA